MSESTKKLRVTKAKKPIQVVAVVTPNGIEGSFTPEPRKPLIVHLPFKSNEVKFEEAGELRYDPNPPAQPEPYEDSDQLYFNVNGPGEQDGWKMERIESASTKPLPAAPTVTPAAAAAPVATVLPENFTRTPILACYATEREKTFEPPASTPVRCYWCSFGFEGSPCFLPVKEEMGVFTVYGNFCCPQCALAYLLKEHLDSHVRWERMALLHRMYRPVSLGRLYPSPPREVLTEFGGTLTIEQYRELVKENKIRVDVHVPPLVSILGQMDTKPIDFYDSSVQNTFTGGFSMDRFKMWSEQGGALRLKRSKPLKDRESTLDAVIQITVKRGGE